MAKTVFDISVDVRGTTAAPSAAVAIYSVFDSVGPTVERKRIAVAASMNKTLYNEADPAEFWASVVSEINTAEGL